MNAPAFASPDIAIPVEFVSCFEAQRAAYREALAKLAVEGLPSDRAAAVALSMLGQARG